MQEFEVESEPLSPSRGRLWVVYLCVFSDSVCFTYIFSFLPYYVEFLISPQLEGLTKTERDTEVAYHSGVLGTSYSVGQIICSFLMGSISDKIGRRPVLLLGSGATVLITMVFGLIPTYSLAVVVRFLNGLCNSVVVAARSLLSDCTTEENRVSAFVKMNKYGLLGVILGPCIGGGLAEPNRHLPDSLHFSLFDVFPFLLPCVFCFLISLCTFLLVWKYAKDQPKSREPLLREVAETNKTTAFQQLKGNKRYVAACSCWCLTGFSASMYVELISLWGKTAQVSGGLGWRDEYKVGLVLFSGSVAVLLYFSLGFTRILEKWSTGNVLWASQAVTGCVLLALPHISHLENWWVWPPLLLCSCLWSMSSGGSFTSINIIINSAVGKVVLRQELYGSANGLALSCVAFVRAFGPVVAGGLFGWCIGEGFSFPFDHSAPFFVASGMCFLNVAQAIAWLRVKGRVETKV